MADAIGNGNRQQCSVLVESYSAGYSAEDHALEFEPQWNPFGLPQRAPPGGAHGALGRGALVETPIRDA
jgi:hypothetical protein